MTSSKGITIETGRAHSGAVEEIAEGEQCGEHVGEGCAAAQVVEAAREVRERLDELVFDRIEVESEEPELEARAHA